MAGQIISKVQTGDGNINIVANAALFICTTGESAATKIAKAADSNINSFVPIEGTTIKVYFANAAGTPTTLTLQTNGGNQIVAATNIYKSNFNSIGITNCEWGAGKVISFTYCKVTSNAYGWVQNDTYDLTSAAITAALGYTPTSSGGGGGDASVTSSGTPAAVATSASLGSSTYAAKADHVHNITRATITAALGADIKDYRFYLPVTNGATELTEKATTTNGNVYANLVRQSAFSNNVDVVHAVNIAGAGATTVTANNSNKIFITSIDTTYAAADTVQAVGTSAVTGSSTAYARADHIHNITAATITTALGYTPASSGSSGASVTSSGTPAAVATAANIGSSAYAARADHVHNITKATITTALGYTPPTTDNDTTYSAATTVQAVATAAVTGTSTAYARADHIHNITAATITSALGNTFVAKASYAESALYADEAGVADETIDGHSAVYSTTAPTNAAAVVWINPN